MSPKKNHQTTTKKKCSKQKAVAAVAAVEAVEAVETVETVEAEGSRSNSRKAAAATEAAAEFVADFRLEKKKRTY